MFYRRLLLFFLLFLISVKGFSAVFIVTSNADAGPGTLREALTLAAANGSAAQDIIQFNLPDISQTGRVINLVTQLPDLTSNLIIDGSTQTGSAYGSSGARVELNTPATLDPFTLFNGTDLNNVALYALFMHDYTDSNTSHPDQKQRTGANITNSSNIIFGAPGKGILIEGFWSYTMYFNNVNNLTFKGSVFGLSSNNTLADPALFDSYTYTGGISIYHCNNIQVGGDALNEGNIIFCHFDINLAQQSTGNNITFKSNNFGVFADGKSYTFGFQEVNFVNIYTEYINQYGATDTDLANSASATVDVENNVAGVYGNVFIINAINGNINFYKNFFGISRDGAVNLNQDSHPDDGNPLNLFNSKAIINIGSNDPSKGNFIAYSTIITSVSNCPNVLVRNNEYQCIGIGEIVRIYGNDNSTLPTISIDAVNEGSGQSALTGTATPGSLVDIYGSESCTYSQCSIRKLIKTVTADANGVWNSDIINFNGTFYVTATQNNITSLFETYSINTNNLIVKSIRCSGSGSITGLKVPKGLTYHWVDSKGNTVSNNINLITNKPDNYQLILGDGCITSTIYKIDDDRLTIYDFGLVKTDVSCSKTNGSIKGLYIYDPLFKIDKFTWLDGSGNVIGNQADIENLAPGSYTLKVTTLDNCEANYGPVIIKNISGPSIDQSKANIKPSNCGTSTGSITNILSSGSGTLTYIWWDSQQHQVATTKDLLNQPAGVYSLQVKDESQCDPVYTTDIIIPETNGITLDESKVQTTIASCGQANGSITGMLITGTAQYKWVDANNKTVSTTKDLLGAAPGDYTFTADNNSGCSKTSQTYHISLQAPTQFPVYAATIVPACFKDHNGSVSVAVDNLVKSVRWVDGTGQTVGAGIELPYITAGTYRLYLTDKNGCETLYNSYTINELPEYIVASYGQVADDKCGLKSGGVSGVVISGGLPPYTYTWRDANNVQIGTTASITGLAAGKYILNIVDSKCGNVDITYTVNELSADVPAPAVSNVQLCSGGEALISANNPSATTVYRLYDGQSSLQPIDEKLGGRFKIAVPAARSFYISQMNGTCESPRSEMQVTVGLSTLNIPNAFTPNGDGINDTWKIPGMENYPASIIQIFTRYGQRVFESKGYALPFDGTLSSKALPAGTYYYIINLGTNCSILSGNLTIIR